MSTTDSRLTLAFVLLLLGSHTWAEESLQFDHWTNKDATSRVAVPVGEYFGITVENTCPKFTLIPEEVPEIASGPQPAPAIPGKVTFDEVFDCVAAAQSVKVSNRQADVNQRVRVVEVDKTTAPVRVFKPGDGLAGKTAADVRTQVEARLNLIPELARAPNRRAFDIGVLEKELKDLGEVKDLKPVTYDVYVEESGFIYEFGAGFFRSSLTDPRFAIDPATTTVMRNSSAEDDFANGVLSLVHMSYRGQRKLLEHFALSFGLGSRDGGDLDMFAGVSLRLGRVGFITFGQNFGKVERLPTGQQIGAAPINDNALSDLPTRNDSATFLAWTFPFLGNARAALEGPFEEAQPEKK